MAEKGCVVVVHGGYGLELPTLIFRREMDKSISRFDGILESLCSHCVNLKEYYSSKNVEKINMNIARNSFLLLRIVRQKRWSRNAKVK
jgi:hypothetical protein